MRDLRKLNHRRDTQAEVRLYGVVGDQSCGCFRVGKLNVIASSDEGWEHVSVSLPDRTPTWLEMDHVKRLFWHPDETVMQLHVSEANHISGNERGGAARYCLHLWRPTKGDIPTPPKWMIDV